MPAGGTKQDRGTARTVPRGIYPSITSSSIIELVDDEMGEDYAKLAGLTAEEDLKEPLKESMKKRIVKIALGQFASIHGETQQNLNKMLTMTDQAAESGADLIVFPELAYS